MRRLVSILVFLLLCTGAGAVPIVPRIANPGFEEAAPGNDAPGWEWYARCRASFRSTTENPHSGARCMVFTNADGLAPEVYSRMFQGVGVLPATTYELSVWVRGENVSDGLHFTDWGCYTLNLPSGTYGWRKVSTVFTTGEGQTGLNLGINVVNKCKSLAIDDLYLRPVGEPIEAKGVSGIAMVPKQVIGDNKTSTVRLYLTSSLSETRTIHGVMSAGKETLFEKSTDVKPGENDIEWKWNTGTTSAKKLECRIRLLDARGKTLASLVRPVAKMSSTIIVQEMDGVESRLKEFDDLAAKCRAKGIPIDYPMVTRTMLDQFIPLERQDIKSGEERRASFAIKDFNRSIDTAVYQMRAYLRDPSVAPNAVRYQTGPVRIRGLSFIGERADSKGNRSTGPLFFCGHGHFGQVCEDMPRWPGYGVNIIQYAMIGPGTIFPAENEVTLKPMDDLVKVLDDAAEHNVRVDFLVSPHIFPDWAMMKWPHLGKGGGGFLGFCVDCPEAKDVVERYLRLVIPMVKDKPALHSICLTNEPLFDRGAGCDATKPMWADYLKRVHGDIGAMNTRYGTQYAAFSDVPMPGNGSYGDPQFYDWCVFNQERFAGWHAWMADIIHEMAPNIPIHAKMMWIPTSMRSAVSLGIDPELFAHALDINGNDCMTFPGNDYWAIGWTELGTFYDLQRSMARKPVFNSENHLQGDGSTYYVAPEHYRTALWQGAIHGQGATTIWVWGRAVPGDASSAPFYGGVMDRPGCAEAVGTTCLDLNRFADEVTALQNAQAPVAILYSMASYARQDDFLPAMRNAYTALNFCGVKIDYISEKQLAAGKGRNYRMIVLPDTTHIPDAAFDALRKLPSSTRLVCIGKSGAFDPYGHPRPADDLAKLRANALCFDPTSDPEKVLWPALLGELDRLGARSDVAVTDARSGKPVWGVEWLPVRVGGKTVINMVDLRTIPFDVFVTVRGQAVPAHDLLSLGGKSEIRRLKPITPVLAVVGE